MARRLSILDLATFAAAIVFVISSCPRFRPAKKSIKGSSDMEFDLPNTTVPAYVEAKVMNDDPNVRAAGASVEAATVYTTYADVEASYVARSLEAYQKRICQMRGGISTVLCRQFVSGAMFLSKLQSSSGIDSSQ